MKLHTSHTPAGNLKHLVMAAVLMAAPLANAQSGVAGDTFSYFYGPNQQGGPSDFNRSLADANYDSWQYNHSAPIGEFDNGQITAWAANAFGVSRHTSSFSIDAPTFGVTSLDGSVEEITSVTLYLYIIQADVGPWEMSIFSGLNSTTGEVATFTITGPDDVGGFFAIDIPKEVAFSGFSIGNPNNNPLRPGFQSLTESHTDLLAHPGFRVNTQLVPEPTTALLCGLGVLSLLRRRRA